MRPATEDAMQYHPDDLDRKTHRYLRAIAQTHGRGYPGVFVPQTDDFDDPTPPPVRPPAVWRWKSWRLLFAFACLGAALWLSRPGARGDIHSGWQIALMAASCLSFLSCLPAPPSRKRRRRVEPLGSFLYVDARYVWEVLAERVRVIPIDQVTEMRGEHHHEDGIYSHTRLLLTGASGTIKLILSQRRSAEEVVAFLDGIIRLRQAGEKTLDRNPELLGFLAQQMSKGSSTAVAVPAGRLATQTIPHPRQRWRLSLSAVQLTFLLVPTIAVAIAGFFCFPSLNDDRRFATARSVAEQQGDFAPLRRYAQESDGLRHREEARELLVKHYDDARKALLAHTHPEEGTPSALLLQLLERLREESNPVLTIGFEDATAPEQRGRGEAFTRERCERRERIVLDALRRALSPWFRDLLTVERAPVTVAHLAVVYRLKTNDRPGDAELGGNVYGIDYQLLVRLRQVEVGVEKWESLPDAKSHIVYGEGEPDWVIPAMMLHAAFHSLAAELLHKLGLEAPVGPSAIRFEDLNRP
jgi:hypothetical protein